MRYSLTPEGRSNYFFYTLFPVVIDQAAFQDDLAFIVGKLIHFQGESLSDHPPFTT